MQASITTDFPHEPTAFHGVLHLSRNREREIMRRNTHKRAISSSFVLFSAMQINLNVVKSETHQTTPKAP